MTQSPAAAAPSVIASDVVGTEMRSHTSPVGAFTWVVEYRGPHPARLKATSLRTHCIMRKTPDLDSKCNRSERERRWICHKVRGLELGLGAAVPHALLANGGIGARSQRQELERGELVR